MGSIKFGLLLPLTISAKDKEAWTYLGLLGRNEIKYESVTSLGGKWGNGGVSRHVAGKGKETGALNAPSPNKEWQLMRMGGSSLAKHGFSTLSPKLSALRVDPITNEG